MLLLYFSQKYSIKTLCYILMKYAYCGRLLGAHCKMEERIW